MAYGAPNTNSTLSFDNHNNKTSTALSTNILISVNGINIGAIQSLTVSEKREVKMIDEVGTDGHIDSAPQSSTNIEGQCKRVRFDKLRVAEAFGRGFTHVAAQAYPFDITILDRQKLNKGSQITTIIRNVWITGIDYEYQSADWIITDTMTYKAETIYSFMGTNSPVAIGGERGFNPSIIQTTVKGALVNIEQETDRGYNGRRGSLDADGLIDLGKADGTF